MAVQHVGTEYPLGTEGCLSRRLCHGNTRNILGTAMFSMVQNQVIGEVVLDGGGCFSPAGIVGVHTLSLLLPSQTAHDRAAGNTIQHTTREIHNSRQTHTLTRGYSNPRQGSTKSVPP